MDREKLEKQLEELRTEIGILESEAPESAQKLKALADKLEQSTSAAETDFNDLREGVQSNIEHFEVEHQAITAVLNRIATLLSNMGI